LPISEWYDNNIGNHLDYPPLAGYIHYLMGFIVKFFGPEKFYSTDLYTNYSLTMDVKLGIRISTILTSLVFYYPAAACVVLQVLRKSQNSVKLFSYFLLLNMPIYVFVDNCNTQVNGPVLGLLLWCLYFTYMNRFYLAVICFSLSISYKHLTGIFVFPIAFYMISSIWRSQNTNSSVFL